MLEYVLLLQDCLLQDYRADCRATLALGALINIHPNSDDAAHYGVYLTLVLDTDT